MTMVPPYHVRNPSRLSLRFFSKAARQNPERRAWFEASCHLQGPNCHSILTETDLPLCPTCCPSGHLGDDSKRRNINFLDWHHERHTGHQNKLPALQQDGPIPGCSTTHTTHLTRVPVPVRMCRLLPLPSPHLPCHCQPLL